MHMVRYVSRNGSHLVCGTCSLSFLSHSAQVRVFRGMKCPDFANSLSLSDREHGESRTPTAPATSCAAKKAHELVTTGSAVHTGFPRAMVLAACFVLPVERPLLPLCRRRRRIAHRLDARV